MNEVSVNRLRCCHVGGMLKLYPTNPLLAPNLSISQCVNRKHCETTDKPTIIPHAPTRPKTDFTGLCITIPRLEGTQLFVDETRLRYGCCVGGTVSSQVQGQMAQRMKKQFDHHLVHKPMHIVSPLFPLPAANCHVVADRHRGERTIVTFTQAGRRNAITPAVSHLWRNPLSL